MALPIPLPAPVTIETFPANGFMKNLWAIFRPPYHSLMEGRIGFCQRQDCWRTLMVVN